MKTLRFGVLGAARIAPKALTDPARGIDRVEVTRIAARDRTRAVAFASEHGVPEVSDTYADLINADDVDVVYNPLPMNLHAEWTIAALRAGKHVLCEKPLASNADEAEEMVRVADELGLILGEAFHHHYHPMMQRILNAIDEGVIGSVVRAEGTFAITVRQPDIRWDYATSGGSLMDLGCYPLMWARHVIGEEPAGFEAEAIEGPEQIDASIWAELSFPGGATGRVESSMALHPDEPRDIRLEITGDRGSITAINPLAPQNGNRLTIRTEDRETSEEVRGDTTYAYMLRAFVDHVIDGAPFPTQGRDSVNNMVAIDAIYQAAGLAKRGLPLS